MIIENSKNASRLIDNFISELFLAINFKEFTHDTALFETKFTFEPFELRLDYSNRIEGSFLLEDKEPPVKVKRMFSQEKSLLSSRVILDEPSTKLEDTETSTITELDQFDKLFQEQQNEEEISRFEPETYQSQDKNVNLLVNTDCHRWEVRARHRYLNAQQRKSLSKFTVLQNRSHSASDSSTQHRCLKEVVVNCIYIDSSNTPAEPTFLSDAFQVNSNHSELRVESGRKVPLDILDAIRLDTVQKS